MMRTIFCIAALFIIAAGGNSYAQSPFCGSDLLRATMAEKNPVLLQEELSGNEKIYESVFSKLNGSQPAGGVITIPVVFHVMHNNGPENVPDSVIIAAVEELNLRFQNAATYYDSTGHQVNVQFCLATIDPQGNPTTGITRTVTPFTNFIFPFDDQALKNQVRWSPELYYNVWVVFNISGFIDGYSSFPVYAGQSIDGVVIEYLYITNSYLFAHETGHYCGLYHTFEGACPNFNCMLNGDQVCDTPPDNSSIGFPCMNNSCSTELQDTSGFSPFISDVNELPNYMDYTTCPLSFTQGQADRMESAVATLRSNLSVSNGCGGNPGQALPVAGYAFSVSPCDNGIVTFSDSLALNTLTSEWDFNNDGIYDTLAHNFLYTFPATGIYPVKQRVTGIGGQDSLTQLISVHKGSSINYPIVAYPGAVTDTIKICEGDSVTFEGDPNGVSYLWNTGDTTSAITFIPDSSMNISLTMTDTTGYTWTSQCVTLYLQVHPFNIPVITYDDTLGYTCADEILTVYVANPIPGVYTWQVYHISTGWFNTLDHNLSLNYYADPVNGSQFYVTYSNPAGCTAQSNTLYVQPQQTPFFNNTQLTVNGYTLSYTTGNFQYQWYNNNIPIAGATTNQYTVTSTGCYNLVAWDIQYPACDSYTDTVCFLFSGMDEVTDNGFQVAPNPASGEVYVHYNQDYTGSVKISLYDMVGTKLKDVVEWKNVNMGQSMKFPLSDLADGIYLLEFDKGNSKAWKKIMVSGKSAGN